MEYLTIYDTGLLGGPVVKNPPANAGDMDLIPGSGRSSGEGNGNPLWYSCLGNPMNRGVWWGTVYGVTKESDTAIQLSNNNPSTLPSVSENRMSGYLDYWTIAV